MWYVLVFGDFGWMKVYIKYINKFVGSLFILYFDKYRWCFMIYMDFNLFYGWCMLNWYIIFYYFDLYIVFFFLYFKF